MSNRKDDESLKQDFDIWYVEKQNGSWLHPVKLPAPVNTDKDEFYPSSTRSGSIYFTRKMNGKDEDIVRCTYLNGAYQEAERLSDHINTTGDEFNAYVDPDEKYILFTGYRRSANIGSGDLYISRKNDANEWNPAVHLDSSINSIGLTYCPYVSPDGKALYFSSNRITKTNHTIKRKSISDYQSIANSPGNGNDDIYWIRLDTVMIKN